MIFAYKGIDAEGRKVRDKIEAASLDEAKSKLKANRIIYQSIAEETPSIFDNVSFSRRYRISPKELAQLSRELAMYIRSGITIVSAIKIVQVHYEHNKKLHLFLKTVSTYLDEGKNLYGALESQSIVVLPEFFKQSIKVSESSGILDEVLLELSRFLKEQDRLRKEVVRAFIYPGVLFSVALLVVALMLVIFVPKITAIFEKMNQDLPVITQIVITSSNFVQSNFFLLLGVLIVGIVSHKLLRQFNTAYRYTTDLTMLKLPLFGPIVLKNELARFTYVGSLLVRSGVPFVQTIKLSANIIDNSVLYKLFNNASDKVVEGKQLSVALHESKMKLDDAFIQAIALGEETSQLEPVLSNVSELYFEENRDNIRVLLSLLEPMLMLFVGITIGLIIVAMLLPIFSMSIA